MESYLIHWNDGSFETVYMQATIDVFMAKKKGAILQTDDGSVIDLKYVKKIKHQEKALPRNFKLENGDSITA